MKNPRLFEAGVVSCLRAGGRRAFVFDGADGIERCREDEPEEGRFIDANPTMKNVYLVHQMINEQEAAVADYLRMIKTLQEKDPSQSKREEVVEYE